MGANLALVTVRSGGQAPVQPSTPGARRRPCCARRRRVDRFARWLRCRCDSGAALLSPCAVWFTNALYCYCARAYLVSASYASRILKEQSVWKRPVPFSEPGAALFLTICSVSSP